MGLNDKLVEKAKTLGINHEDFKDDDSLTKAIEDKEKDNDLEIDVKDPEAVKKEIKKWKEEAKKAFDSRDEIKKERRKLQQDMDALKEQIKVAPNKEELDKLTKELKELKTFKEELDRKKEEDELKNKSEAEKIKIRFEREFEDLKKKMDEAINSKDKIVIEKETELKRKENEIEGLRRHRLKSEIMEQAAKLKAYNPAQVARLLLDEFEYDKDLNQFFFYKRDSKGKITNELEISERVKEFLSDPENDNLVESEAKGGTGHEKSEKKTPTDKKAGSEKKYDPKDADLIAEAEEKGLSVEDYIEIQKLRDAKLAKIREGKK